jgi:hypothetical protein
MFTNEEYVFFPLIKLKLDLVLNLLIEQVNMIRSISYSGCEVNDGLPCSKFDLNLLVPLR